MPDACTVKCSRKRVLALTRVRYANTPEKLMRGENYNMVLQAGVMMGSLLVSKLRPS